MAPQNNTFQKNQALVEYRGKKKKKKKTRPLLFSFTGIFGQRSWLLFFIIV